ncbi:hypothetical protein DAMA08_006530 [Martiniozyma asiatica (nom. inval.)]|nr:hypothetical protein DAMA08_006530 [Martiniozyma asiatica]
MLENTTNAVTPIAKNALSISSHVVHGYVGNDALQFPLNLRNWNLDAIHTTKLSTHPGHGLDKITGTPTTPDEIRQLYKGLTKIQRHFEYDVIICGYMASAENWLSVWEIICHSTSNNKGKNAKIIIDPVMGDNGNAYVSEKLVNSYIELLKKDEVTIDLLTPNKFEFETLVGCSIANISDLKIAIDNFWSLYPSVKNLVITSVEMENKMICVGCTRSERFYCIVEEVNAIFSGSGDLFLAILTDEFTRNNLKISLAKTVATVTKVLNLTHSISLGGNDAEVRHIRGKIYIPDLKIVQCRDALEYCDDSNEIYPLT